MSKTKLSGRSLVIRLDRDELRVALMILGSTNPTVLHSVVLPVPEGAVDDGFIAQPEAVKELLRQALLEPQFKRCSKAVISLCTTQIITELTTTPVMSEKKLDKMLRANMDMYFPVDTRDYNLVWKINGSSKNDEGINELSIQLWAVSNNILERYYTIANQCGLNVVAVQWCGSSVVSMARNSLAHAPKARKKKSAVETAEEESILYVVAEREHMIMTIMQGQRVRSQRMFQCGSDPEASLREVAMLLDYYNTRVGNYNGISCVFAGKLADDPAFIEAAQYELGMPVTPAPFAAWFLCMGASVADMDFGDPTMNRRGAIRRSMGGLWQYVLILAAGAALVICVIYTLGSTELWKREISSLEATQLQLRIKYSEVQNYASEYNNYISKYSAYSSDWDTLFASVKTYNDNLVIMLDELESILPETTSVTNIAIQPTGLQLRIACPSKEEAAFVIMALRELKYADLMAISSLTGTTGQAAKPDPNEQKPTEGSAGLDLGSLKDILDKISKGELDLEDLGDLDIGDIMGDLDDSGLEFGGISADTVETITQLLSGSVDMSKLSESDRAALLRFCIEKEYATKAEVETELRNLSVKDIMELEEVYGNLPETEMSLSFLQSESSTEEKNAAISAMLNSDRIARMLFSQAFNEDLKSEKGQEILYKKIRSDLTAKPRAYSALLSGNETTLERYIGDILTIITKNADITAATEKLICTDEGLAKRYAWHLEQELYYSDDENEDGGETAVQTRDELEYSRLATDIVNNTLSAALSTEGRKVAGNVRDAVILRVFASGKLKASDLMDILTYLKPDVSDPEPTPTPTPPPSTTPGKDDLADLLDQLLNGNKTPKPNGGGVSYPAVDRNIYFDVVLGYDTNLIIAEMEREGLSYGDKVVPPAELEVGQ